MTRRFYPKYHSTANCEMLYVVMEAESRAQHYQVGDPKPYHEANDEADERNNGTWGQPKPEPESVNIYSGWLPGAGFTP